MKTLLIFIVVVVIAIVTVAFNKKSAVAPGPSESPIINLTNGMPVPGETGKEKFVCQSYVCADGAKFPSCDGDGAPINYLVDPCQDHGGRVFRQASNTPAPTMKVIATPSAIPKSQTVTVTFANGTAMPANVTIRVGDTVKFVNNDNVARWPASGVHPTHQICPGLNSLRGLNTAESYSFTFREAKTCPWHDHLQPSINGKIEITP